ncbi:hypothetical protein [Spirosoma radiotolerans]|uniref:Lipoprotein n=1 Tax=Spirosoma radiotolerans TaxID=1379870 RepID=A0A0E3ZW20_9BACT|nr:hypothetical protein [Spirosoma radiotolerans]AKD55440.1 hypothetical protein SD10_11530 [Spirosoma radiotolerans]
MKPVIALLFLGWTLARCATTQFTPTDSSTIGDGQVVSDTTLTIFLLERDIPADIKRLGVITISVGTAITDKMVKERLKLKCKELGANGAYRISDGFYPNAGSIPYLVFRYRK